MDKRHGPDLEEVHGLGIIHTRITLGYHPDELLLLLKVADQLQRTIPSDGQR